MRVVRVTTAQVLAAKGKVARLVRRGEPVPPALEKIANARRVPKEERVTMPRWFAEFLVEAAKNAHYDLPPDPQQVEAIALLAEREVTRHARHATRDVSRASRDALTPGRDTSPK